MFFSQNPLNGRPLDSLAVAVIRAKHDFLEKAADTTVVLRNRSFYPTTSIHLHLSPILSLSAMYGVYAMCTFTCGVRRTSATTAALYGGDYGPDDEPPPDAVLEEKRILEHRFRRPSPSRRSSSSTTAIAASTSLVVRQPCAGPSSRPVVSRSLRAKASAVGSSPRRSLHRSSAFSGRRSTAITDRGRTASMPSVPNVRVCALYVVRLDFRDKTGRHLYRVGFLSTFIDWNRTVEKDDSIRNVKLALITEKILLQRKAKTLKSQPTTA